LQKKIYCAKERTKFLPNIKPMAILTEAGDGRSKASALGGSPEARREGRDAGDGGGLMSKQQNSLCGHEKCTGKKSAETDGSQLPLIFTVSRI
jgi:hypothetical protein